MSVCTISTECNSKDDDDDNFCCNFVKTKTKAERKKLFDSIRKVTSKCFRATIKNNFMLQSPGCIMETSRQSYKGSMTVNYSSRVIIWSLFNLES